MNCTETLAAPAAGVKSKPAGPTTAWNQAPWTRNRAGVGACGANPGVGGSTSAELRGSCRGMPAAFTRSASAEDAGVNVEPTGPEVTESAPKDVTVNPGRPRRDPVRNALTRLRDWSVFSHGPGPNSGAGEVRWSSAPPCRCSSAAGWVGGAGRMENWLTSSFEPRVTPWLLTGSAPEENGPRAGLARTSAPPQAAN